MDSIEQALLAEAYDIDGIELCAALETGGITPSIGLVGRIMATVNVPVRVLIRPKAGSFVYSEFEKETIRKDIHALKSHGVSRFVVGALNAALKPDMRFLDELRNELIDCELTFNRAIDETEDPIAAMVELKKSGFDRILTSGGHVNAQQGAKVIREAVEQVSGVVICAAAGINSSNVRSIVDTTGVSEIHFSLCRKSLNPNKVNNSPKYVCETDVGKIQSVIQSLTEP